MLRDATSYVTHADNADRALLQHGGAMFLGPWRKDRSTFPGSLGLEFRFLGQRQNKHHRLFRHGGGVCTADIGYLDAALFEQGNVDVIDTRMQPTEQLQLPRDLQNSSRKRPSDDRVGVNSVILELGVRGFKARKIFALRCVYLRAHGHSIANTIHLVIVRVP
ncbi:hypothetical protein ACVWXO_000815 [Bradyrhizobium sp. LM2.7]